MSAADVCSGKRVLVTGGAGFIGSHLTHTLVEMGAKVRVVDNLVRGSLENLEDVAKQIEFIKGDLTSAEVCKRAVEKIDYVFHLASKVGGIGYYMTKPGEVYTNNILMDTQMALAARAAGVQRYVFSSSAHVYPRHLQSTEMAAPLHEAQAYPADPAISYGWAKLFSEKLIQYQNVEELTMRTAIVRIVGAFGERQDIDLNTASAIPAFCRRAVEYPKQSPFKMLGEGKETRSYCYVGDVVDGMIHCLKNLTKVPEIGPINLGNEGRVTIADLVKMVIEVSGKKIEVVCVPTPESGIRGQAVDCALARQQIPEWKPRVSLKEGILRTYRDVERRLAKTRG